VVCLGCERGTSVMKRRCPTRGRCVGKKRVIGNRRKKKNRTVEKVRSVFSSNREQEQ